MTPALYEKLYNASPPYNDYMISIPNIDSEKDTVTNDILKQDGVININYLGNLQSRVEEMLTVLNQVIVVLVVSAGMNIRLGGLAIGAYRNLTEEELRELTRLTADSRVSYSPAEDKTTPEGE